MWIRSTRSTSIDCSPSQWPKWRRSARYAASEVRASPFSTERESRKIGSQVRKYAPLSRVSGSIARGFRFMGHQVRHVRASHERAGEDSLESHGLAGVAIAVENRWMDVLDDVELLALRLEVLADRADLDAGVAELAEDVEHFIAALAEAEHQARLRGDRGVDALRLGQHRERAWEARAGTHVVVEPRHGLDVVVEVVGLRRDDGAHRVHVAVEVGGEHFDDGVRQRGAQLGDRLGELRRAAVAEIVARDRGDDDVAQSHPPRRLRDRARLLGRRRRVRPAGGDVAEAARARADVAEDHERGRAAGEAVGAVGTGEGLADGMEGALAKK